MKSKILNVCSIMLLTSLLSMNTACGQKTGNELQKKTDEAEIMELANTFAEILNAPTDETGKKFAFKVYIPEQAEGIASLLRADFGKIEVGRIRIMPGNTAFHLVAKIVKTGEWKNFQVGIVDSNPKRCKGLFIGAAVKPVIIPKGNISDPAVLSAINEIADQLAKDENLSGSILIAKGDKILLKKAYGSANIESGRLNNLETPFNLASGGKMFTAIAVLKLVQEKKLNLSDPVSKFIPNYPDRKFAMKATVAHLLSHTSGLGDFWDEQYEEQSNKINDLKDYIPHITRQPLRFENPGETGSYSNSGYILLGMIIEKITGENYFEHIKNNIFKPLAMNNTGFYRKDQDDIFAVGYDREGKRTGNVKTTIIGSPAGGAFSTVADIFKFKMALENNKLLNAVYTKLATNQQAELDNGRLKYGYGFVINDRSESDYGHSGIGPGASSTFYVDKIKGYTLINFSNRINGAMTEFLFTVSGLLKD